MFLSISTKTCFNFNYYAVVGNYINTIKTTFDLNFYLNKAAKQLYGCTKTWSQENLSKKSFSLITWNFVIRNKACLREGSWKTKVGEKIFDFRLLLILILSVHCFDIIAYHWSASAFCFQLMHFWKATVYPNRSSCAVGVMRFWLCMIL